ncbi:leucyl aminopeptidase [Chitinilyticum piscinae]|uniref:Probable cytosol aminopeptidase n=1 Tax=Chitinilyticum piscinae TaxID=2866724 RepID=A0A8J7K1F4_9NEIS|nr:leucyl aminopeptidase [Chitinilyticum piscinae]MBE9609116.1 leucyl aminopeptidase [Chitinilyticum piscinae]
MEFTIKQLRPVSDSAECLILPVSGKTLPDITRELDDVLAGRIGELVAAGDLPAKAGSTQLLLLSGKVAARKLLLVQTGETAADLLAAARAAASALVAADPASATSYLAHAASKKSLQGELAAAFAQAVKLAQYQPGQWKSASSPARKLAHIQLSHAKKGDAEGLEQGLAKGLALGHGMNLTRELGDTPGNLCTPTILADRARELAREFGLGCDVLERHELEQLGMGSFLAVAKGSSEAPKLIVLQYKGGKKGQKPVALVGKGITFDSGGISLKPGEAMDEMKYDMCGAATVLGVFRAVAELGLAVNLVGVIPSCENMPAGNAAKPGDVVTSMAGLTIEILNTDAEGRLILCDALTFAAKYKPDVVIDIATLTGACVIALGNVTTGLFANDDELADDLLAASRAADDKAWRLPLYDEYQEQLKSNFADMANIGGRPGGAITAACFLSRFAKDYRWAHLDIAGTAWKSGAAKGATGRPVPLLVEFLSKQVK